MRIKKKAIVVCAAALFLLTGVLMLRGKSGLQEGSTGSASPGYIFESVTGSVIEPRQKITAGLKTNSGTAVAAATEKADKTAVNGVFLAVVSFVIFLLVGIFVTGPFYTSQTDDAQIVAYGKQYLSLIQISEPTRP